MAKTKKVVDFIPATPRAELEGLMRDKLAESGLEDCVEELGFKALDGIEVARLGKNFRQEPGILMPYFDPRGKQLDVFRVRYFGDSFTKERPKYMQVKDGPVNDIYLAPAAGVDWAKVLDDESVSLIVTEGEFKAGCATKHGFPTIGLGGVTMFQSKKKGLSFLPRLSTVKWKGRDVVIIYDSDMSKNDNVLQAERDLATALMSRGATVRLGRLPSINGDAKTGLDDFLMSPDHGPEALRKVLAEAQEVGDAPELHELNSKVVYVRKPGFILRQEDNFPMSSYDFVRHQYSDSSYWPAGAKAPVSTAEAWLKWPKRFKVYKTTYKPGADRLIPSGEPGEVNYNLWLGFAVEPKKGNIEPFLKLLDYLFGDDIAARDWFLKWCAFPLQNPGAKMTTCVAIWGHLHGTGKSFLGLVLGDIYGIEGKTRHANAVVIDNDQLEGKFNGWAGNKQFIIGEEITSDRINRKHAAKLKKMITEETTHINEKFIREHTIEACANYYFSSNEQDAFFLSVEDRRFFIHEVKATKKLPGEFYRAFDRWRKHEDGPAHLLEYLLSLDLTGFDPNAGALPTKAKEEMIYNTKTDSGRWCLDLKRNPAEALRHLGESIATGCDLFTAEQLLSAFRACGYDPHERLTQHALAADLKEAGVCRQDLDETVRVGKATRRFYFVRNVEKWKNASPAELRAHWTKFFNEDTTAKSTPSRAEPPAVTAGKKKKY